MTFERDQGISALYFVQMHSARREVGQKEKETWPPRRPRRRKKTKRRYGVRYRGGANLGTKNYKISDRVSNVRSDNRTYEGCNLTPQWVPVSLTANISYRVDI